MKWNLFRYNGGITLHIFRPFFWTKNEFHVQKNVFEMLPSGSFSLSLSLYFRHFREKKRLIVFFTVSPKTKVISFFLSI